jgi:hypothetical protein
VSEISDLLGSILSTDNISQISNQTGVNQNAVKQIAMQGIPALLEGLNRNSNAQARCRISVSCSG